MRLSNYTKPFVLALSFTLVVWQFFPGSQGRKPSSNKSFQRVMVFPGGGLQFAIHLGALAAYEDAGQKPNLVIGTCGGSIAALLANYFEDPKERKEFLLSEKLYTALKNVKLVRPGIGYALNDVWEMIGRKYRLTDTLPDFFSRYILSVPTDFSLSHMNVPFKKEGSMRAIMIAAQLNYGPEQLGQKRGKRKLMREVYFTDDETAQHLAGLESEIGGKFPDSYVDKYTRTITDAPMAFASRASISDPYYINPGKIGDTYFLTGAVNLYPLELAQHLGDEVIMPYVAGFDSLVEQNVIASVFGFDNNKRLRNVTANEATRWVDFTDTDVVYEDAGFNPSPNFWTFDIESRIPDSYEEYRRRLEVLWSYGYERGLESLKKAPNDKSHIRIKDVDNTETARAKEKKKRQTSNGPKNR